MSKPWFRMYSEFDDDPKVQMLPEDLQRRLVMLFCARSRGISMTDAQRAFKWRITLEQVAETKAVFLAAGFIDENWEVVNWRKRQFLSDSSTNRVQRHRDKVKRMKQNETPAPFQERFDVNDNETLQGVPDAVEVVVSDDSVKRDETPTDTDTDTETEEAKKQKTSPKAKPSGVDPRFGLFRKDFETAFQNINGVPAPWDAKEATNLSRWLKSSPTITQEQWRQILRNWKASPVAHGLPLSTWLTRALSWLNGHSDEWGKPVSGGKNANARTQHKAKSDVAVDNLRQALGGGGSDHVGPDGSGNSAGRDAGVGLFAFDGAPTLEGVLS